MTTAPDFLRRNGRPDIAYRRREGAGPGLVWMGGFRSDMLGSKAETLDAWAAEHGRAFLRFDYAAHGESGGAFEDETIGSWLGDALACLDDLTYGPQILIGSSMGGWIATLAALARPERVAGLVCVAPAPDFTEALMWAQMSEETRAQLTAEGRIEERSEYSDEPTVITKRLIEEGREHLVLGGPIAIAAPVHVLQGMADPDVPWTHALKFVERLQSRDVVVTLVKEGDHRLSTPEDLARLVAEVEGFGAATFG